MDALALLLKHKIPHTFISSSNHISILVWFYFNEERTEKYLGGITFTYSSNISISTEEKNLLARLKELFKSKNVPTLEVVFNETCTDFLIDGNYFNAEGAIDYINKTLNIPPKLDNGNKAKPINATHQVKDSFHLWSRENFHPNRVIKQDIDVVSLKNDNSLIIFEIKRSDYKNWAPFSNDSNNYESLFILQKYLECQCITMNHPVKEEADEKNFKSLLNGREIRVFPNNLPNLNFTIFSQQTPQILIYSSENDQLKNK
ncbi:hypothetical protein [Acinetobacter pittii]|uniref:hypothetical protein n=1 Tax=Acinetobacter pittii TaxID=48296 RepID=UPI00192AE8AD|nr:hypothetical protein [Acinetobacter pittii]